MLEPVQRIPRYKMLLEGKHYIDSKLNCFKCLWYVCKTRDRAATSGFICIKETPAAIWYCNTFPRSTYMCPSLTFCVQLLFLAILRIWYRLKWLGLKISILKTERKYSYYLCQYHHFEVNA